MSYSKQSKSVCIVGAGASGLTTIKQLLDEGHRPTCFERDNQIGGVFNRGAYDNTILTISNYMMAFSDLPPTGHRRHWTHHEYKAYLQAYSSQFNLKQHIHFKHEIIKIIRHGTGYNIEIFDHINNEKKLCYFDAVAICTGVHQIKKMPQIEGVDTFTGKIIHSSEYKNNASFKNKNVVCIGIGESGADIVREIAEVANNTHLSIRSYPFLIPRVLEHSSSDAWTSRIQHARYHLNESIFYYLLAFIFSRLGALSRIFSKQNPPICDAFDQPTDEPMLDFNTKLNIETLKLIKVWCYLSKGNKFATKNVTFIPYILNGKIKVNASGIKSIKDKQVYFNDGRLVQADIIVACTGFQDNFDYISGFKLADNNVKNLFVHAFHPEWSNLVFIGWARPLTGGVPACSEMIARYFSLLLSEKRSLPHNMSELISKDKMFYADFLEYSQDISSLMAWKRFNETIAQLIGCQLKLWKYLLKPRLLVKLMHGSLLPYQYRFEGPHNLYKQSKNVLMSLPVTLPVKRIKLFTIYLLLLKLGVTNKYLLPSQLTLSTQWLYPNVTLTDNDIERFSFVASHGGQNEKSELVDREASKPRRFIFSWMKQKAWMWL